MDWSVWKSQWRPTIEAQEYVLVLTVTSSCPSFRGGWPGLVNEETTVSLAQMANAGHAYPEFMIFSVASLSLQSSADLCVDGRSFC